MTLYPQPRREEKRNLEPASRRPSVHPGLAARPGLDMVPALSHAWQRPCRPWELTGHSQASLSTAGHWGASRAACTKQPRGLGQQQPGLGQPRGGRGQREQHSRRDNGLRPCPSPGPRGSPLAVSSAQLMFPLFTFCMGSLWGCAGHAARLGGVSRASALPTEWKCPWTVSLAFITAETSGGICVHHWRSTGLM